MTGNSNLSSEEEIIEMEIIEREAKKFGGNASHVILPTKYNGKKVQIKILNQKALSLQRQELASLQEKINEKMFIMQIPINAIGKRKGEFIRVVELEEILKIFKEMGQCVII
jgi:putative transposon-encoded protein